MYRKQFSREPAYRGADWRVAQPRFAAAPYPRYLLEWSASLEIERRASRNVSSVWFFLPRRTRYPRCNEGAAGDNVTNLTRPPATRMSVVGAKPIPWPDSTAAIRLTAPSTAVASRGLTPARLANVRCCLGMTSHVLTEPLSFAFRMVECSAIPGRSPRYFPSVGERHFQSARKRSHQRW